MGGLGAPSRGLSLVIICEVTISDLSEYAEVAMQRKPDTTITFVANYEIEERISCLTRFGETVLTVPKLNRCTAYFLERNRRVMAIEGY